ncbi:hypothetical protein [Neptunicella marina]|uniref:Thiamin/hydroxymethyl pyrimidine-binding YkoF putative domain-containing protein n=1 Tax=Neptunicella marina TaxID=2125989 RepID=A0A8J6ITF6_9ALTE|nr:hypothetical protein [Neptunicella marina]MBC3765103.1 hypothetical protein [Neptunicella marina]
MKLIAEISLYPLNQQYITPIKRFIERLNQYPELTIDTGRTSTVVEGEYISTMRILAEEMQRSHQEIGQASFVCKFLNGDAIGSGK